MAALRPVSDSTGTPNSTYEDVSEGTPFSSHGETALEYDVATLSQGRGNMKKYRRCRAPLWILQMFLVVTVAAMTVIPAFVLYLTSVRKAVNISVQSLLKLTALNAEVAVSSYLTNARRVALNFGLRPSTIAVLQSALNGTDLEDQLATPWLGELTNELIDNGQIST
ncbi:hypothetical protein HKX48_007160 [Thoreauomyces humboldtii]|nr:hypothetical protein HKX48_007160 [Thoreauomyces humboldtii]